jgi:hypothetical protein
MCLFYASTLFGARLIVPIAADPDQSEIDDAVLLGIDVM